MRARAWPALLLLAGAPLLYNLVYLGKMWQMRQLLPVLPMFAALAAIGAVCVWQQARPVRWGAVALAAVCWLLPPKLTMLYDGPHAVIGRLWSPLLWWSWQGAVKSDFARIDAQVAALQQPSTPDGALLLTDEWNADRYVHLALQQAGWRIDPSPTGSCNALVETFRRGDRTVRHLRLHVPYVRDWVMLLPQAQDRFAARCPALLQSPAFYVAPSNRFRNIDPVLSHAPGAGRGPYRWKIWGMPPIVAGPLTPPMWATLQANDVEDAASARASTGLPERPLEQVEPLLGPALAGF